MHRLNPRLLLPLLLLAGILASCEEVQEAGEYDNWQARNTAFIDSLNRISTTIVATEEDARMVQPGQMFRILDDYTSTSTTNRYIYCRKLTANDEGKRPMATSTISNFMYGTLINGEEFYGNFTGYSALDQNIPLPPPESSWPTAFDSPDESRMSAFISGVFWPLQYMREGERWMIYIPWDSAYGSSGSGTSVPGYSMLTYDVILEEVKD